MRYAVFTDIHANLEALQAVLAKIDEIAQQEPIDEIWFLGDLVGYGPDPNACIETLRARTDVIIAGNHDWAAVGKIDLDDFSAAARISAEWTAMQLTEEHKTFLSNLPERIIKGECTLVHGSPYGPLWEYLTSEVLAERSFGYFDTRYCFVGHTHVPVIFQQPDLSSIPTIPLGNQQASLSASNEQANALFTDVPAVEAPLDDEEEETTELAALRLPVAKVATSAETTPKPSVTNNELRPKTQEKETAEEETPETNAIHAHEQENEDVGNAEITDAIAIEDTDNTDDEEEGTTEISPAERIKNAEEQLNDEIEELLELLGLSQSMIQVTNEMIDPPEGHWQLAGGYRAIINPGGVGQPRDGDPRAAFMIYDTERGFTFYRVAYDIEKTQEKIIQAGLPPYLATRLAYGR